MAGSSSATGRDRVARGVVLVVALVFAALATALCSGAGWATAAWPWPEPPMSFLFLGSIAASIAAVWLSIAIGGELAALAGVGVNAMASGCGAFVYLAWHAFVERRGESMPSIVAAAAAAAFGVLLWRWAARLPVRDPRPTPVLVRAAFAVFVVTLVVAGSALAVQAQVFPWRLRGETATLFGFVFLGAAAYFAHALRRGRWAFAAPPLWGFLAYDLVLIVPYARLLLGDAAGLDDLYGEATVNRASLVVYLFVLAASALLVVYMVAIHPATRLWRPRTADRR